MLTSSRHLVLILGGHRSGTSALSRVVNLLGAQSPNTLMPPQADNPKGFWESLPITRFNERVLLQADRSWDDPRPIEPEWFSSTQCKALAAEAASLLAREFADANLMVLKDPRISRLMPVWRDACALENLSVSALIGYRQPEEMVRSLCARNAMSETLGHQLWVRYLLDALDGSEGLPCAAIEFGDLMARWQPAIENVFSTLGGPLPALLESVDKVQTTKIEQFLDARLKHHQAPQILSAPQGHFSPATASARLHSLLKQAPLSAVSDTFRKDCRNAGIDLDSILVAGFQTAPSRRHENYGNIVSLRQSQSAPTGSSATPPFIFPAQARRTANGQRAVLVHCRLHQAADVAVDAHLRQIFGRAWQEHEGQADGWRSPQMLKRLSMNPQVQAVSSDTMRLSASASDHLDVFAIVFLQNPVRRATMLYQYERSLAVDTEGHRNATRMNFSDYVQWRLDRTGDRSLRNYQTLRLAQIFDDPDNLTSGNGELAAAEQALFQMGFVGDADNLPQELERLRNVLCVPVRSWRVHIPERPKAGSHDDAEGGEISLDPAVRRRLVKANAMDLQLHDDVLDARFSAPLPSEQQLALR